MIRVNKEKQITLILGFLLVMLIVLIIVLASVPPVSRDALTHHLAVPKLWIAHGGIYEIPDIKFSYYPMNLDLLYVVPLYWGNDIVPKYIHFAFALATAWIIFSYLRSKFNRMHAFLGALIFLSTPVVVKLSITAYVDLGLIFFTTLSLFYLMKWAENEFRFRYLAVAAVSCGLGLGTKYNGLISLFLLTIITCGIYIRWFPEDGYRKTARHQLKAMAYGALFFTISCLIFSPWGLKNYVWTGNPLYPLYQKHFQAGTGNPLEGKASIDDGLGSGEDRLLGPTQDAVKIDSHFIIRKLVYEESWLETALIPLRIFFQGQDDNPKYFDGRLNPFLLLLPLFAFSGLGSDSRQLKREVRLLCIFSVLYVLIVFFQIDMRIRWISPVVPALAVLAVIGLQRMENICDTHTGPGAAIGKGLLWLVVAAMFTMNILYLADLFRQVRPINYLLGNTSRDAYIERFHPEYSVIQFANSNTPQDSVILCFFLGKRRYYSDRSLRFDYNAFRDMVKERVSPQMIAASMKAHGISHLIVRHDLFNQWHNESFTPRERKVIFSFFKRYTKPLFTTEGYSLLTLGENSG